MPELKFCEPCQHNHIGSCPHQREIKYMECRGCGEVFEQTEGSSKPIPEAAAHAKECSGGFRRNLTEEEAF